MMWLLMIACARLSETNVGQLLQQRGLTRREAEAVQFRHRRRNGVALDLETLEETLAVVDGLPRALLAGQVTELLRSTPMDHVQASAAASPDGSWCSYKRQLCDCCAVRPASATVQQSLTPPPQLVSLDCEFKPLRLAVIDEAGAIVLDRLVTPDVPPAGRSTAPLPSILKCDRAALVAAPAGELRRQLLDWMSAGTVVLAHTPASDLRALGMTEEEVAELQRQGRVIDVALLGLGDEQQQQEQQLRRRRQEAEGSGSFPKSKRKQPQPPRPQVLQRTAALSLMDLLIRTFQ